MSYGHQDGIRILALRLAHSGAVCALTAVTASCGDPGNSVQDRTSADRVPLVTFIEHEEADPFVCSHDANCYPGVCLAGRCRECVTLDFDRDASGQAIAPGQVVEEAYLPIELEVWRQRPSTKKRRWPCAFGAGRHGQCRSPRSWSRGHWPWNTSHRGQRRGLAVAYDSTSPGADPDLMAEGLGNVLISQARFSMRDRRRGFVRRPNDDRWGAEFDFSFDEPVCVRSLVLLDIDQDETAAVGLQDGDGEMLMSAAADSLGDGTSQTLDLEDTCGAEHMIVILSGSGAIDNIEICRPATVDPASLLQPIIECVTEQGPGEYTALFGYQSDADRGVKVPVGARNRFHPPPAQRWQPVSFRPGHHSGQFTVDFDGEPLEWQLGSQSATASRNSPRCSTQQAAIVADINEMKDYLWARYPQDGIAHQFEEPFGYGIDCVETHLQPGFSGTAADLIPLPTDPSPFPPVPPERAASADVSGGVDENGAERRCPEGTVAVRRRTLEEIRACGVLDNYLRQPPPSPVYERYRHAAAGSHIGSSLTPILGALTYATVESPSMSYAVHPEDHPDEPWVEHSLSEVWVQGMDCPGSDWASCDHNTKQVVEAGWVRRLDVTTAPFPDAYASPIFFIYFTPDFYDVDGIGHYNQDINPHADYSWLPAGCEKTFVLEASDFVLGGNVTPVSGRPGDWVLDGTRQVKEIGIKWERDDTNGRWCLWVTNSEGVLRPVGYYQDCLFQSGPLTQHAVSVEWGGEVYNRFAELGLNSDVSSLVNTKMGSGVGPHNVSDLSDDPARSDLAYHRGLQIKDATHGWHNPSTTLGFELRPGAGHYLASPCYTGVLWPTIGANQDHLYYGGDLHWCACQGQPSGCPRLVSALFGPEETIFWTEPDPGPIGVVGGHMVQCLVDSSARDACDSMGTCVMDQGIARLRDVEMCCHLEDDNESVRVRVDAAIHVGQTCSSLVEADRWPTVETVVSPAHLHAPEVTWDVGLNWEGQVGSDYVHYLYRSTVLIVNKGESSP